MNNSRNFLIHKKSAFLFIGCFLVIATHAQTDSLKLIHLRQKVDSLNRIASGQWLEDSLRIDQWSANVKSKLKKETLSDSSRLKSKIDSLHHLKLDASNYEHKLDSALKKKDQLIKELDTKQSELLSNTKTKIEKWQSKVKGKLGIDSLEANTNLKILPSMNIPQVDNVGSYLTEAKIPEFDLPQIPQLSTDDFKALNFSPDFAKFDLPSFENPLEGLGDIQKKIGALSKSVQDGAALAKNTDKVMESSIMKLDEMKGVQDQLKVSDQLKSNDLASTAAKLKDPEAVKRELAEKAKQEAINHFAGKQELLKGTMQKMTKYKKLYSKVDNLKDLELKIKNAMHGKPLKERIMPGVAIQIQKKNSLRIDVNPYVGYRISGLLTSGIGWNQRFALDTKSHYHYQSQFRVYGPRVFVEAKLKKGFFPRLELEMMNTYIPSNLTTVQTESSREWVPGVMIGMKKEYQFTKKVKGTALVMFNLFNSHHKSPYPDVLNTRFGFEFPMKKLRRSKQ